LDCHYREIGPPSVENSWGSTGESLRPLILPDFEYENGRRGVS
jgi:hypothetical protein